jgi:hypothetical protein
MEIPDWHVPLAHRQKTEHEVLEARRRAYEIMGQVLTPPKPRKQTMPPEASGKVCKTQFCENPVNTHKGLGGWCSATQADGSTHRLDEINRRRDLAGFARSEIPPRVSLPSALPAVIEVEIESVEMVHHPDHYGGDTTYEVIKVLEAWGFFGDALLFNAVKYIARAGKKGEMKIDLEKAIWYLQRKIETLDDDPFEP